MQRIVENDSQDDQRNLVVVCESSSHCEGWIVVASEDNGGKIENERPGGLRRILSDLNSLSQSLRELQLLQLVF